MLITPVNTKEFKSLRNAVFLAGPCPREDYDDDWRNEAVELLDELGFDGDIISPTNPEYDGNLVRQTEWEHDGLCLASRILFWIPRTEEHPGFTTNIEFGEWMHAHGTVLGYPTDSIRNEYVGLRFGSEGHTVHHTLKDACREVAQAHTEGARTYFTSDTHFSAERTLKLSRRPYSSVREMDLQMMSNWNKRVGPKDTVFHLGDFGNPDVVSMLNFGRMYLVEGNYEKRPGDSTVERLLQDPRVSLLPSGQAISVDGVRYRLCHEPTGNDGAEDDFWLYGHIHRLQLVKRNGVNVGMDANRFAPMSVPELKFLRGGVEDHFDENVFTDSVR